MTKDEILKYLYQLNDELKRHDIIGEMILVGGAVMCLSLNSRESTKDIDAIFEPKTELYSAISNIADYNGLPKDWINDAVKEYIPSNSEKMDFLLLPNLRIQTIIPECLLAMKLIASRVDSEDINDIRVLLDYLGIRCKEQAMSIAEKYYKRDLIPIRMKYVLEELFDEFEFSDRFS